MGYIPVKYPRHSEYHLCPILMVEKSHNSDHGQSWAPAPMRQGRSCWGSILNELMLDAAVEEIHMIHILL